MAGVGIVRTMAYRQLQSFLMDDLNGDRTLQGSSTTQGNTGCDDCPALHSMHVISNELSMSTKMGHIPSRVVFGVAQKKKHTHTHTMGEEKKVPQ
mmetsp:Transcript_10310/g.23860  ORF Transcript_10310/g.23860 Transcript_10310/m.23860 type:complete len:95 (-) Transcript_10310:154-438(-)